MAKKKDIQRGRPTKYDPAFCDEIIDFMAQGYSAEAFAGHISIVKDTLYRWFKEHQEFSDSYKIAQEKCRIFWERKGIEGLETQTEVTEDGKTVYKNVNPTMWIFNMKNRFRHEWKDKQDIEHSGEVKQPVIIVQSKDSIEKLNSIE